MSYYCVDRWFIEKYICSPRAEFRIVSIAIAGEAIKGNNWQVRYEECKCSGWIELEFESSPGGVLNNVLYGEAPPRGPNPYLLYSIFDRKGNLFIYLP